MNDEAAMWRDYAVTFVNAKRAEEMGLANAKWYATPISREQMKALVARRDGPAMRDTIIWFAVLIVSGVAGYFTWGTWWAVPCFFVYGTVYGSSADSRWHECGHGTAFKTRWMNEAVYQIACFMLLREPTIWKWSHTRHHTDTIIVGRDPEIAVPRPPDILGIILNFFSIKSVWAYVQSIARHVVGRMDEREQTFVPKSEYWKVFLVARIWVAIFAAVIIFAIAIGSFLPLMYVGLPTIYGAWFMSFVGLTQHAGMAEDVLDHRLNTRTVYMNPISRFLYWNMNYHVEHHMFPMVPYHALPKLHEIVKNDMPKPYSGMWEAYSEIIPTLLKQVKDPSYHVVRELPPSVKPRNEPMPMPPGAVPAE